MSAVSVSGDAILDLYPCLAGSCGDGIVDVGEECDPLFPVDQSCNPDCTLVVCGDGDVEGDEECDDGNTSDGDGCSALCTDEPFACGNSVIEAFGSEVCDDGDSHGGDGCSADCLSDETCGNGVTDTLVGEACDDGGTADGDGCSADCGSDETCGNGVIDAIAGEACDDGNTAAGDGCDGACAFEGCGFFNSAGPLGMRLYSVDPTVGGLFNSIVGLGTAVGNIGFTSGPFELVATATDATGTAVVTLATDVIIGMPNLGGFTQCLKFEAAGSTGTLHCCGGHAVGMSFTRDSNRGGIGGNGPGVPLAGRGAGAPGDLAFAFQVSEGFAPQATPSDCATTTYGSPSSRYLLWTTGTATGRVVRPEQGGAVMEFSTTGQAFDCSMWTVENDIGSMVSADTALNAIPGFDAANVRILDDQAGD
jgi:cysteine-rich repeat protein